MIILLGSTALAVHVPSGRVGSDMPNRPAGPVGPGRGAGASSRGRTSYGVEQLKPTMRKILKHDKAQSKVEEGPKILESESFSQRDSESSQAEAGLLRETYRESNLNWLWNRAGVADEIKQNFRFFLKKNTTRMEYIKFAPAKSPHFSLQQQERYVRCYVIAPFCDMQAERRLLAQEVFPTLRTRCMQVGVHFVEVDFGWGVPEKLAERKKNILNRLLEMRQNVRTYIIGLLGERYGYKYYHDSNEDNAVLDPLFLSKRPTVLGMQEVELDEGSLRMDGDGALQQSFFYFRDARYFDQVLTEILNLCPIGLICSFRSILWMRGSCYPLKACYRGSA